ncbi:hypothetical protein D1610_14940 [Sphingomonas gilva]|uniref:Thioredoxin domain-containing protein n=1 Tax=Sphingomonas gilva TaxID=2305907 RepID=A0A396RKC1_9SPHN|nr:hypothetical protein [Sphingomonas gilva]RHW16684.1 hypothetical protein D1610_14940 [Sphingomonas gilva]
MLLTAAAPADTPPPKNAILLFVASWCAPCHGELRMLGSIGRQAAPMRVIVVPIDARRGTEAMIARVPENQLLRLEPRAATAMMRRLSGGAPGLPTAVAIDRAGRVCGVERRSLVPERARALRLGCLAQP